MQLEVNEPFSRRVCLARWDARRLPLGDGSVDGIIVDLPFGKRIGSVVENRRLYPQLLRGPPSPLPSHNRV